MTKVKICGLTRMEDIEAVNRALPDFIGFVFAESRRRIDIKTAARLREQLNTYIKPVGIFVNEQIDIIADIYNTGIIGIAQLHGEEDDRYIAGLKDLCGVSVIKSVGINGVLPSLPAEPDYLLFDALSGQRGGTGMPFDWNIVKGYGEKPYFLAGGLSCANVLQALDLLNPYCADVSSGVETNGMKDALKILEFVNIVRRNRDE